MHGLRLTLAVQLAFFAAWGGHLMTSHRSADALWLETRPVDPRDLLSGHFVALRYPIAATDAAACATFRNQAPGTRVFVKLAGSGKTAVTTEGPVEISAAVDCRPDAPGGTTPGETLIAGEVQGGPAGGDWLVFGIERFYVPETSPLRDARGGDVIAKVAINAAGRARIVDLVPIQRPVTVPPTEPSAPR